MMVLLEAVKQRDEVRNFYNAYNAYNALIHGDRLMTRMPTPQAGRLI